MDIPDNSRVSRFENFKQRSSNNFMSWTDLIEAAKSPVNVAKANAPCIVHHNLSVKTYPAVKSAEAMTMLSIDIDSGDMSIDDVHSKLTLLEITTAIIHSTATSKRLNSNNEVNGRKWRVLIPLTKSINCDRWIALQTALATNFQSDDCVTKPTQILFLPNNPTITDPHEVQHYEFMILVGEPDE
tara:strand:+ start:503 stop:1057 length:555 start_codon:yes stop_codon:yes gene_type:complete